MQAPQDCIYPAENPFFPGGNPYVDLGQFEVEEGWYSFLVGSSQVADRFYNNVSPTVLLLYQGAFNPEDPGENLLVSTFIHEDRFLEAGTYQLVAQYCGLITSSNAARLPEFYLFPGHFAFVIRGHGQVSGIGVESPAYTFGFLRDIENTAEFPGFFGERRYTVSDPLIIDRTGDYLFPIARIQANIGQHLFILEGEFDPQSSSNNYVAPGFSGRYFLEAGKTYSVVNIMSAQAQFDDRVWQYLTFPAGETGFSSRIEGAWAVPGVLGQGIMIQTGVSTGVMFFAWFTFDDEPVTASNFEASSSVLSKLQSTVGSAEQRWL
ncbi:MAG: hypothetical protein HKO64_09735, partial [Xanthomonadales bacterium]|nr:hypothetical protein [Xanthomonadales bacterium]